MSRIIHKTIFIATQFAKTRYGAQVDSCAYHCGATGCAQEKTYELYLVPIEMIMVKIAVLLVPVIFELRYIYIFNNKTVG